MIEDTNEKGLKSIYHIIYVIQRDTRVAYIYKNVIY